MRRGQIGTDYQQRMIFIWEGAIATLPEHWSIRGLEHLAVRTGQSRRAVDYWKVQHQGLALMWSLLARTDFRIDLCVTTRPPRFAEAVADKVLMENWPVHYVFASSPESLGRRLSTMPDVARVYYGLERQRFAYGPNGYFIDPAMPLAMD